jgi:hypothetical protein
MAFIGTSRQAREKKDSATPGLGAGHGATVLKMHRPASDVLPGKCSDGYGCARVADVMLDEFSALDTTSSIGTSWRALSSP